ncbi:MAG: Tex family protein [Candidatus Hodarchaeota archaeon]
MPLQEDVIAKIHKSLSDTFNRNINTIKNTLDLFEKGNTVPFIARYRKEVTSSMDEVVLRDLQRDYTSLVNLEERRNTILNSIEEQGKLTDELKQSLMDATTLTELEDLYLPYKPKRQTKAQKAREAGLEPLANLILFEQPSEGDRTAILQEYLDPEKGINNESEALGGAVDIIIETISENAEVRKVMREIVESEGRLKSAKIEIPSDTSDEPEGEADSGDLEPETTNQEKYKDYFEFELVITKAKPYQVLAINRGENEGFLDVDLSINDEHYLGALREDIITNPAGLFTEELTKGVNKGYSRMMRTIKRETWVKVIMEAKSYAVKVFAENVKKLLMQPPLKGKNIIGIDPGYRTGCKVSAIDTRGKFLEYATIYPHPPKNKIPEARAKLIELAKKHDAWTFAIGNGTASRETEMLLADMASDNEAVEYTIVSEAGASVYSASDNAREEFPDLDVSIRGAISIARRLLDPLSELIKIDPKSIGVGLYQHDVNQTELGEELESVVEDCVNAVGVDANVASVELLTHVSGLNSRVAKEMVKTRQENGSFKTREEIKDVKFIGEKTYEQSIGFLKVFDGSNPLDTTFIHPESYLIARNILEELSIDPGDILDPEKLVQINKKLSDGSIVKRFEKIAGKETLQDVIDALRAPRRDPRDDLPPVILRKDILKVEDLKEGMIVKGTVRNVLDFGAFVDIGVKYNGLVHISQISNSFVKNPHDHLSVGDVIDVMVLDVDLQRKRIQLSIKEVINKK